MDSVGTDMQLISPRPFQLNHSAKPAKVVHLWVRAINDTIARSITMHPTRFRGVAGLPQVAGEGVQTCFEEIDRCINELGFAGVLLNPDPGEGDGKTPNLGDEYWYPLWEKLVKMDVPAHIHSAGCYNGREVYVEHFSSEETLAVISIYRSHVFEDFPALRLMVSHGAWFMTNTRDRLIAWATRSTRLSVRGSIRIVIVFSAPIINENESDYILAARLSSLISGSVLLKSKATSVVLLGARRPPRQYVFPSPHPFRQISFSPRY